jgi:AcrR family transcriptional regulator
MDFNSAVAAAVRAEQGARGWTNDQLAERAGISRRTVYRLVETDHPSDRGIPEWKANYIALAAAAFGMSVTDLVAAAERRQGVAPQGADPRTLIQFLLDHPDRDEVLTGRLADASQHVGNRTLRSKRLGDEIRQIRSEELMRALASLPPSENRAAGQ